MELEIIISHKVSQVKYQSLAPVAMPVILATWETEIKRIMVQGQPRQIVLEIPSPN
jgi:hypothetical protein